MNHKNFSNQYVFLVLLILATVASSVVVKNTTGEPVPPKTLNEAGTMAICNSAAWDAKVVTSAWWVNPDQVSKTAPSGEYLTTGSFMIRGKKNYLPPSYLIYGFGFFFKLEDGSVARHIGERKVRNLDDDAMSTSLASEAESGLALDDEEEEGTEDGSASSDSDGGKYASKPHEDNEDDDSVSDGDKGSDLEDDSDGEDVDSDNAEGEISPVEERDKRVKPGEGADGGVKKKPAASATAFEFPDTSINLTHVKGEKFELQRLRSNSSSTADAEDISSAHEDKSSNRAGGRLSAKQRREMRKAKKVCAQNGPGVDEEEEAVSILSSGKRVAIEDDDDDNENGSFTAGGDNSSQAKTLPEASKDAAMQHQQQPQQPKRGRKGKLRKIKEKYCDQDEEERKLKMEILASSGPQKEDKKKKNKKGKGNLAFKGKPNTGSSGSKGQGQPQSKGGEMCASTSAEVEGVGKEREEFIKPAGFVKEEAPDVESEGEQDAAEEDTQTRDDLQIFNSMTGQPHPDDELLYAIPCCAPYNALTSYKFKVKLLPGTTKRGKAAKAALNMFQHDKSATPREKDLLRIMKDADLSRNMPGKVKVAAPNLHKR